MKSAGKTLTVSYGAFSCTLEGYEDPVAAVREIAACFMELSLERRRSDGVAAGASGVPLMSIAPSRGPGGPAQAQWIDAADGPDPHEASSDADRRVAAGDAYDISVSHGDGVQEAIAADTGPFGDAVESKQHEDPAPARDGRAGGDDPPRSDRSSSSRSSQDGADSPPGGIFPSSHTSSGGGDIAGVSADEHGTEEAAREPQGDLPAPGDPDVERLFAATDSRLRDVETSRRQSNLSHLRAAAAARMPDGAGPDMTARDAWPDRDASTRADVEGGVPLLLAASQMVRRPPDPAESFAKFAAEVGATGWPDILEAAALFRSRALGETEFTRADLLDLAGQAFPDLDREDARQGLREILRRGLVRELGPGRYGLGIDGESHGGAGRHGP